MKPTNLYNELPSISNIILADVAVVENSITEAVDSNPNNISLIFEFPLLTYELPSLP